MSSVPGFRRLPNVFLKAVASPNNSIKLFRVAGIPIRLHFTWFLIFVLITLSFSVYVFPQENPTWPPLVYWAVGLAGGVLFSASILAHELSHSIVSKANGVPVRSITLFIFGGIAQISREASRPVDELKMAVAGPALSMVLGITFWMLALLTQRAFEPVSVLMSLLGRINLGLALFNMVPGFPLDGGRVLRSILWHTTGNYRKATRVATLAGQGVAFALIATGITWMILTRSLDGIWFVLVGWFLENAASASYRQAVLKDILTIDAAQVMSTDLPIVPPSLTLRQLIEGQMYPSGKRFFLVAGDSRLEGIITFKDVKAISPGQRDLVTVAKVMTPRERLKVALLTDNAAEILEVMDAGDFNQVPVMVDERVVGIVTRETLLRAMKTRAEVGGTRH